MPDDTDTQDENEHAFIREAIEEALAEGGGTGNRGSSWAEPRSGAPSAAGFRARVDHELRAALGRVPNPRSPKSFIEDLNAAFKSRAFAGREELVWQPRLNVGAGDFGSTKPIMQTLVSERARKVGEQVIPILEQLRPLDTDADPEELEALRASAITALQDLVEEMNRDAEIRGARVVQLFGVLGLKVDPKEQPTPPLAELGMKFGFVELVHGDAAARPPIPDRLQIVQDEGIVHPDEEQMAANFIEAHDAIINLAGAWMNFVSNRDAFFTTQLHHLSQALALADETVGDVYRAMDSVSLGSSKRRAIPMGESTPSLSLEDFLAWADEFVGADAPEIIRRCGRIGARDMVSTLGALWAIASNASTVDNPRFKSKSVQGVWSDLINALKNAHTAAQAATGSQPKVQGEPAAHGSSSVAKPCREESQSV